MNYSDNATVLTQGEHIYFSSLREKLETTHMGEYVVIDIKTGKHIIGPDQFSVIEEAQEVFNHRKLYLVQVGDLQEPSTNFLENKNVSWIFSK